MDPAVVFPLVPLLPSAGPALVGPFVVAAAVGIGGLATIVWLVLQDLPARQRGRRIVLDVGAHPVVEGRAAQGGHR